MVNQILVTGANGFIGQAICHRLLSEGLSVRGSVRTENGATQLPAGVVPAISGPISPDTDWTDAVAGVDTVIHLAARAHVLDETALDPLSEFRRVNSNGTEALARAAAGAGVRRFVFLSSIGVLGSRTEGWALREMDESHPHDDYTLSKWEAEQALQRVAAETGLEVVILRVPLVYGPGVKANFLRLLRVIDRGIPLPLSSVNNRRSLLYVGNLVDAIVTCIKRPQATGRTYLVSDGEDVSTPELVRRTADALEKPARLLPFPTVLLQAAGRLTGMQGIIDRLLGSLTVDSRKIRSELQWKPPYTMEEGLRDTASWFRTAAKNTVSSVREDNAHEKAA